MYCLVILNFQPQILCIYLVDWNTAALENTNSVIYTTKQASKVACAIQRTVGQFQARVSWEVCSRKDIWHKVLGWDVKFSSSCLCGCRMPASHHIQGDHLSGKPGNVREFDGCQGKNLVREKWPKTVYCYLHICIHTGI